MSTDRRASGNSWRVTDENAAALRAYPAGEFDLHERLHARPDKTSIESGYLAMVAVGFFEAVDRRFAKYGTTADVIAFVGNLRANSDELTAAIDPQVAERLIRHSLGKGWIVDLDDKTVAGTQFSCLLGW